MKLLEKIRQIEEAHDLCESGIRNIRKLRKRFDKAEVYFHMDL